MRVAASAEAEFAAATKQLKETAALDQFIDKLLEATSQAELSQLVAENLLACNQKFWIRLATRSDTAASGEEKEKLATLAQTVMYVVDALVKQTEGQLSNSAEALQEILKAAAEDNGEWQLPLREEKVAAMRAAMDARAAQLDEALLSNAFAWMRKAADDGLDGMVVLLQKVLQLYAARELSAAAGGGGSGEGADALVAGVLAADEGRWEAMIREAAAAGRCSEPAFMEALQRRMEGTVLNLTSGSYAQRVQAEYLKEVEERAKATFQQKAGGSA